MNISASVGTILGQRSGIVDLTLAGGCNVIFQG